jgi:hypothetical protein
LKDEHFGLRISKWLLILRISAAAAFVASIFLLLTQMQFNAASALGLALLGIAGIMLIALSAKLETHDHPAIYFPQQPFTILNSSITLKILDDKGTLAEYEKHQTVIANVEGITGYTERRLTSDGTIVDIITGEGTTHVRRSQPDGSTVIDVSFDRPMRKGDTKERTTLCTFKNSFTQDQEYFRMYVVYPVRQSRFRLEVPRTRPLKRAWVTIGLAATQYIVSDDSGDLAVSEDRTVLTYISHEPKIGSTVTVNWEW